MDENYLHASDIFEIIHHPESDALPMRGSPKLRSLLFF